MAFTLSISTYPAPAVAKYPELSPVNPLRLNRGIKFSMAAQKQSLVLL